MIMMLITMVSWMAYYLQRMTHHHLAFLFLWQLFNDFYSFLLKETVLVCLLLTILLFSLFYHPHILDLFAHLYIFSSLGYLHLLNYLIYHQKCFLSYDMMMVSAYLNYWGFCHQNWIHCLFYLPLLREEGRDHLYSWNPN